MVSWNWNFQAKTLGLPMPFLEEIRKNSSFPKGFVKHKTVCFLTRLNRDFGCFKEVRENRHSFNLELKKKNRRPLENSKTLC